jgi:peptide/nickel transport system ATP-binding protein
MPWTAVSEPPTGADRFRVIPPATRVALDRQSRYDRRQPEAARMALLTVRDLSVSFDTRDGVVCAVNDVSFSLEAGKVLALLGESGSGKSVTLRAILGLHHGANARVKGEVLVKGRDVNRLDERTREELRGGVVSLVFQEPMTALDPVYTIGEQIAETLVQHRDLDRAGVRRRARALLDLVQVPSPERCLGSYPHEISGGMRQRAMIAIALAGEPELLLADEPTTALDVTVQAQILWLLRDLQKRLDLAVIFVTHDLGVAAEIADDAAVMYAGRIVEQAPIRELFRRPAHPYTAGLMQATVRRGQKGHPLIPIAGAPPSLVALPAGCAFAPRCPAVHEVCTATGPSIHPVAPGHTARCHLIA